MKGGSFPRPREIHHMTPLLERQPDAGSTGTVTAPRAHGDDGAQLTPPTTPGVMDKAAKAAPAARSRRRPGGDDGGAADGAFVCRTCSRRFPSFQALGGHRTGHTRLQARHALPPRQQQKPARAAHECAVCGLEFAMGQALGGHMRRHKQDQQAEAQAQPRAVAEVEVEEERRGEEKALDSSCPPPLEEHSGGEYRLPPLEEHRGGEYEGCSSGSGSEPRLLNLLV